MSSPAPLPPIPIVSSILGITFSALFSGGNFTNSIMGFPTLLLPGLSSPSPSSSPQSHHPPSGPFSPRRHLSRQWLHFFDIAKYVYPRLALVSGAFYGLAAYYAPPSAPARPYFWGASATVLSIFPFTGFLMPTNWKLMALGDEANDVGRAGSDRRNGNRMGEGKAGGQHVGAQEDEDARWEEVPELMGRWAELNALRAAIPLLAIAIAAGGLLA